MAKLRHHVAALPLLYVGLFLSGCAKTGDPRPPRVLIPKPPTDLALRQHADRIVVTVSLPTENTDGSPVTTLAEVELFRLIQESRSDQTAIAEEEFIGRAQRLLVIPAGNLKNYLHDGKLVFRDDLQIDDRPSMFRRAFRYAARFINNKNQTGGLSNQALLAPVPIPEAPGGLAFEPRQDSIRLRWDLPLQNLDQSRPPRIAGYNIYRTEDPGRTPAAPLNPELLRSPEFEDRDFQFDKIYYYAVSVVGSLDSPNAESLPSPFLEVHTKDTFPPGAPPQLEAVAETGVVILLWTAPDEGDVAGYRVYREEEGVSGKQALQAELITTLSYRDEKVESGKKYRYSVTAIDRYGNEGPAAVVLLP